MAGNHPRVPGNTGSAGSECPRFRVAREEVDRLSRQQQGGEDLPVLHAIQRGLQSQVHFADPHVQTVEHLTAKYSAGAAFFAQIDRLARKICQTSDLRPRE